jgi:hypothetical protein
MRFAPDKGCASGADRGNGRDIAESGRIWGALFEPLKKRHRPWMADVKLPRVNERETRAEKFITDCLEARGKAPKIEIHVSLIIYRNKGWPVWLVAPFPR